MQQTRRNRFDNTGIGFLVGFALPVVVFFIVYMLGNNNVSFADYLIGLLKLQALIKLGSLCVFLNSAVFMGFIKLKFEKAARGVLGATIIYAIVVMISRAF
jgi:hypothetical protein